MVTAEQRSRRALVGMMMLAGISMWALFGGGIHGAAIAIVVLAALAMLGLGMGRLTAV